jgi:hypothetical protein
VIDQQYTAVGCPPQAGRSIGRLPNADEFYQILAYTVRYGCMLEALFLPGLGPRASIECNADLQRIIVYFADLNDSVQAEPDVAVWIGSRFEWRARPPGRRTYSEPSPPAVEPRRLSSH